MPKWVDQRPRCLSPTQSTPVGSWAILRVGEGSYWGEAHQLVAQCQVASPEGRHAGGIVQAEQVVFGSTYVCACAYKHVVTINEGRGHCLKESRGEVVGRLGGRRRGK